MEQNKILFRRDGNVAVITFNRPEARNALTADMVNDLVAALINAEDGSVRCLVITGSGGAFCAGADVNEFIQTLAEAGPQGISKSLHARATHGHEQIILRIRNLAKPVIASVGGVAAGMGFSLALACDLRVASEDAQLVMAFSRIGLSADSGATYLLPRLVGQGRAMEMYLNNTVVDAHRALEMGLVSHVWPAVELEERTMMLAQRLAAGPTAAYARVKALIDSGWTSDLSRQLENEAQAIADMGITADFSEGISAFTEKRPPRFQGR